MDALNLFGTRLIAGEAEPPAANSNIDPFLRADTALYELYRLRREVLARDQARRTAEQWRQRNEALKKLDRAIRTCLSHL
jgi:hypothetical protein